MIHFETTNSIFADPNAFDTNYRRNLFVEHDGRLQELVDHLGRAAAGLSPRHLFITGAPGSGKTSSVRYALNSLDEAMGETQLTVAHVTSSSGATSYQLLLKIVNSLISLRDGDKINPGASYDSLRDNRLSQELQRLAGVLYIVVDEADEIDDPDRLLGDLSRLTERNDLSKLKIGVIAIMNDGSLDDKLSQATHSSLTPRSIAFPSYGKDETIEILQKRVEMGFLEGAVQSDVVPLCVGLTGQRGGDVRDGIRLLEYAGENARLRLRSTDEIESEIQAVTTSDVRQANSNMIATGITQTISELRSPNRRLLICVMIRTVDDMPYSRTTDIHRLFEMKFEDDYSEKSIRNRLQTLTELGILARIIVNNG